MDKPHKRLDVWKLSMDLVSDVYGITANFPAEERYSLTAQLRRAAISIPSNIAEGAARNTKREFASFLHVAQGSVSELDTQLEIAVALGHVDRDALSDVAKRMERIDKMLTGLIKSLQTPHA
jgi:four helix bundle protein